MNRTSVVSTQKTTKSMAERNKGLLRGRGETIKNCKDGSGREELLKPGFLKLRRSPGGEKGRIGGGTVTHGGAFPCGSLLENRGLLGWGGGGR